MILLADGGSTSVDWRLVDHGQEIERITTKGANPFFRTSDDISRELEATLVPQLGAYPIVSVHFFGAGCAFPDKNKIVGDAIAKHILNAEIEVCSDLVAAARGLCGREAGIACIMGTGSNSCYYDGAEVIENVSPLGYVLGDEGSGAVLGRLFLGACLKNQLSRGIKEKLFDELQVTPAIILERVYRQPLANRFLASFSPFIHQHLGDETVYDLVYHAFVDFFVKNVMQYDYRSHTVHITGSVAYHYQEVLRAVASDLCINLGTISQSPMDGLIDYYSK